MLSTRSISFLGFLAIGLCSVFSASADPMHLYLTYSGAPETSIDINVIEADKVRGVEVYYDTAPRGGDIKAYAEHANAKYEKTLLEQADGRTVHVAELKNLEPGVTYYFVAGEEKHGFSKERAFRTLPGGTAPFRFVDGGDMGVDLHVVPLLQLAAKQNPDFVVIGGDIAYQSVLSGFKTWDKWLSNWENNMVTPDGRTVPLVVAIGNHEVQETAGPSLEEKSPWYVGLFGRQGKDIYHEFHVGDNAVWFLLDTGHLTPYKGAQSKWLDRELDSNKDVKYKFASYHVPLYPAHRDFNGADSKFGRETWGPIFDKYGLTVAFEHHDHVFKRTKPLKAGKVVEKGQGTIYVGDGCFGKDARTIDPQPRWYNAIERSTPHFWLVDVTNEALHFKALDEKAGTVDEFTLPSVAPLGVTAPGKV